MLGRNLYIKTWAPYKDNVRGFGIASDTPHRDVASPASRKCWSQRSWPAKAWPGAASVRYSKLSEAKAECERREHLNAGDCLGVTLKISTQEYIIWVASPSGYSDPIGDFAGYRSWHFRNIECDAAFLGKFTDLWFWPSTGATRRSAERTCVNISALSNVKNLTATGP